MAGQPISREAASETKLRYTTPAQYSAQELLLVNSALDNAIMATPTGPVRELLTSVRLITQITRDAVAPGPDANQDDALHTVDYINGVLSNWPITPPDRNDIDDELERDLDLRR